MKLALTNLDPTQPFSSDFEDSMGEMLRILIPPLETVIYENIDPWYLNQDKVLRDMIFAQAKLSFTFIPEADDMLSLGAGSGGADNRLAARLATTADVTLVGLQSIDGVLTTAGDRVLVKDQAAAADNGIYLASAVAWTRATDVNTSAEVTPNIFAWVSEGTLQADTAWVLTTDAPIVLGTTSLTWEKYADTTTAALASRLRNFASLTGALNGINQTFTLAEKGTHLPPTGIQIRLFRNGVSLHPGVGHDYTVTESGGAGTGFDTVTLQSKAPLSWEILYAHYYVIP